MISFRSILFIKPFEFLLAASLWVVALLMIVWAELLEHSPIGFETRGIIHHIWHYSLLVGSSMTLFGLFWKHIRAVRIEFLGLLLLGAAIAENTIAIVVTGPLSGFTLAIRLAILSFLAVRCYTLIWRPAIFLVRGITPG